MSVFDYAFDAIVDIEAGLSMDPNDAGNWTGPPHASELRGTKYGISAHAFPALDIASITLAQAKGLYYQHYWTTVMADSLPPVIAILALDMAVNQGPHTACVILQQAAGCVEDGVIGPATIGAIKYAEPDELKANIQARRAIDYAADAGAPLYLHGWLHRLFVIGRKASEYKDADAARPDPNSINVGSVVGKVDVWVAGS